VRRPRIIQLAILLSLALPAAGRAEHLPTKIFTTADGLANNVGASPIRRSDGAPRNLPRCLWAPDFDSVATRSSGCWVPAAWAKFIERG
jgi:hypothetical protein